MVHRKGIIHCSCANALYASNQWDKHIVEQISDL